MKKCELKEKEIAEARGLNPNSYSVKQNIATAQEARKKFQNHYDDVQHHCMMAQTYSAILQGLLAYAQLMTNKEYQESVEYNVEW